MTIILLRLQVSGKPGAVQFDLEELMLGRATKTL
jgi:hypothetical protein